MTELQTRKFVSAQIKEHGIYVVANKIGVQHSTLTRYLGGMRVYTPITEKIDAYAARGGKAGAGSKPSKTKATSAKKSAKKVVKKASKSKKAAPPKAAGKPKKASKPRVKKAAKPIVNGAAATPSTPPDAPVEGLTAVQ
jgi:hypothetical protein